MAKRDELKAFCKELCVLDEKARGEDGEKLWEQFFDGWFLCRFRYLGAEMNLHLELPGDGETIDGATIYVYSDQQCNTVIGQKYSAPEVRLRDLIASYVADHDTHEIDETAEMLHREIDKGIAQAKKEAAS
jgi:hypothetical protein